MDDEAEAGAGSPAFLAGCSEFIGLSFFESKLFFLQSRHDKQKGNFGSFPPLSLYARWYGR